MKKLFSILMVASLSLSMWATTFSFENQESANQTIDGITVTLNQAGGQKAPEYQSYSTVMRLYAKNTITVSGENLKSIQILFSKTSKAFADMTASEGTYTKGTTPTKADEQVVDTWTGNATSVVFTMGDSGQRNILKLVVNGDSVTAKPDVDPIDTTALDSNFLYSEPTAVIVPDTTFYKKEYAFVQNNIRVSCTLGTIINSDSDYYFNCNAGEEMTFEATQPIKGITISGQVRKEFKATTNKGVISYCSPDALSEEEYHEGYPVLMITDIDSTSVTISCEKQLRCYSIYFYFEANPDNELDCGEEGGEGEVFNLTFDTADAVYETELSEDENAINYSIYLYNRDSAEYPFIVVDIYPSSVGDLTGTYFFDDGTLGETTWYQYGENAVDRVWMYTDGAVAVSKNEDTYTVSGYITCDDKNTYNFTFTGAMSFFTDMEYYGNEAIGEVYPPLNRTAPMFDILGRPVDKDYHGIVLQNGYKYIVR